MLLKSLLSRKIWSFDIQEITAICKARLMCQGQHFHCTYGARIMMLNIYHILKKFFLIQILVYKKHALCINEKGFILAFVCTFATPSVCYATL